MKTIDAYTPRFLIHSNQGRIQGGDWCARPPKTYESNFTHHKFVQENNTRVAILSTHQVTLAIVLSQQCCVKHTLISLTVAKPL